MSGFGVLALISICAAVASGVVALLVWKGTIGRGTEGPLVAGFALLFVAVLAGAFYGIAVLERMSCRNTAGAMGIDHRYAISTDCLVRVHDRWIPLEQVQDVGGEIVLDPGNPDGE